MWQQPLLACFICLTLMGKRFVFIVISILSVLSIAAVPALRLKKKVKLADGSMVELTLQGDEHYSYYTDNKGNPCQLQKNRQLKMLSNEEVTTTWSANKKQRQELTARDNVRRNAPRRIGEASSVTTGKQRGLVILLEYPDVKFTTPNAQQTFQRFFNEEGYHDDGMAGSVRDYFLAQSYGKLELNFDVVGPYTTSKEMAYYGAHYTDSNGNDHNDSHPALMVAEAVDAASKDVNFSNYDWNKDGKVDQVFVIYAGYAEAQGAAKETVWPHEWQLLGENATRQYNGVVINTYGCAAELCGDGETWGGTLDGIGTACHEFSHCMGLPDMYDTQGSNYAMAYWDVMCSGSYNDNSRTPAGYTSYERWFSGWMEPVELNSMTRINDMQPLATSPEAYILYNENNRNEYYLLENRQPIGFDTKLYGHGLLILHVDYNEGVWSSNSINTIADHQRMTIIAADNEYNRGTGNSMAGDPWPGTSGNTSLTNYTTPAATLYNANKDGRKLMSKPIDNITEDVQNKTVSFVACRPEMDVPVLDDATVVEGGFSVTWPAITGAIGYELEVSTMNRVPVSPEKALRFEEGFSKFYSKTAGFTDISSKLSNYGLTGNWGGSKLYTSPGLLKIGTSTASGYVKTPIWTVPESHDMTIVIGADVIKAGQTVKVKTEIKYGNEGDAISASLSQTEEFEVAGNVKNVLHFKDVRKDLFWLTITPSTQMYLNYLAIYDGIWTADQLGIGNRAKARRANLEANSFITETNSYTFLDVDADKRFVYRVRALGEENTFSNWSEESWFEFPVDVIDGIEHQMSGEQQSSMSDERLYDLTGRRVHRPTKGIYIRKGEKVMVR